MRFARLRMEKRHNYVRKVAETAVQMYITNDKPNVAGLVLAGSADFKTELSQSDMFDPVSTINFYSFFIIVGKSLYGFCILLSLSQFFVYFSAITSENIEDRGRVVWRRERLQSSDRTRVRVTRKCQVHSRKETDRQAFYPRLAIGIG